jgi:hypothetical protein
MGLHTKETWFALLQSHVMERAFRFLKKIKIKSINQIYLSGESMVKYTQKSLLKVAIILLHINARN